MFGLFWFHNRMEILFEMYLQLSHSFMLVPVLSPWFSLPLHAWTVKYHKMTKKGQHMCKLGKCLFLFETLTVTYLDKFTKNNTYGSSLLMASISANHLLQEEV